MSGSIDLVDVANGIGGFVIHGEDAGDRAGFSVASAGDLNGDGFDDIILGARAADAAGNAKPDAGAAYVVFGKASGFVESIDLAAVAQGQGGFVIQGEDAGDYAGVSVASAGDLNGDGFNDVIIGASDADGDGNARRDSGAVYVVFGRAGGFRDVVDLAAVALGEGGFVIQGKDLADFTGNSVAAAGDVNGDGFDDVVIGAYIADPTGNVRGGTGAAYVVFGKAGAFGAKLDLAAVAQGVGGFLIQGEQRSDYAGSSVASAGDVNGDGFADLIVGAEGSDGAGNGKDYAGAAYVVFGKATSFAASIDLAQVAQGQGGFVIQGEDEGDQAGTSVASAGDINDDGFDDVIVGGRGNAAYVVFGKSAGFDAEIDLGTVAQGQGGFVILGEAASDFAGYAVASAGDLNGDGIVDLVVGASNALVDVANARRAGAAYVVFGKAGGFGASIDLAAVAQGQGGFVIRGEDASDRTGIAVAAAGDLDGDGFDDLIVGADFADAAGNVKTNAGAAYVVFGTAFIGTAAPTLGTDAADSVVGTAAADRFDAAAGRDRIDGGNGDDRLAGGDDRDRLRGNAGDDLLAGGLGDDTLAGGLGADTLAGGQGADAFRFVEAGQGGDFLLDFATGIDWIEVSAAGFGLTPGEDLAATGRFVANAEGQASGAIGQFVFDTDDLALLWDADGTGGAAAVLLARLDDPVALTAADFRVIA